MKKILFYSVTLLLGANLLAQNVGIGTSTPDPSAKLDVVDSNRGLLIPRVALSGTNDLTTVSSPATSLLVYNTNTAGDVTPGFYYWNGTQWVRLLSTQSDGWKLDGNNNGVLRTIGTNDNFDFPIETNGIERMRVTTAGNVGIGTAAPGAKLDVAGRVALSGLESPGYGGASAGVAIIGTPNSGGGLLFRPAGLNSNSGEVLFRSGTSYFSGNVGIGTTTPAVRLHVPTGNIFGGQVIRATAPSDGVNAGIFETYNETNGRFWHITQRSGDSDKLIFWRNNGSWADVLTLTMDRNVGIGITWPRTRLDVRSRNSGIWGNGTSQDGPTNVIIEAGNYPARMNDWPSGWEGGLSTWEIVGGHTYFHGYFVRSDRAYKTNISPIESDPNFVQKFMQLKPVTYNFNRETIPANEWDYKRLHYGFIANEVEELFPDIVVNAGLDPSIKRGLEYDAFIPMLVKMVQNLQQENTSLKSEMQELKNELNHLKAYVGLKSQK